ncbi:hypothetical protein WCE10_21370, partial [Cronobacter muytjensii]|uniref:hypothetical protein n=1 Tax=Cronobacter muytjensii TaxID=413501 RepID=UPI0034D41C39
EFEAWARANGQCCGRYDDGEYVTPTNYLWEGWQAARAGIAADAGQTAWRDALEAIANQGLDARQCMETATRALAAPAAAQEGAGEVDAKDAGALEIACAVNKKLGDALLGRSYLLPDDLAALKRFEECASDFDSGGHDVPKPAMARLREIGVVQSIGFGRHQTTAFGDYVLERTAGEPVNLPLMTLAERNAAAAIVAQPKDTTDTKEKA